MGRKAKQHPILRLAFFLYCGFMLYVLFFRTWGFNTDLPYWEQVLANRQTKPFYTIRNFLYVIQYNHSHPIYFEIVVNMLGNILLFVPAGIFLPKLYRKWRSFWWFFIKTFCLICLIEIVQLFTLLGVFDVDDIILNVLGMSFGYFLYFLFMRRVER